MSVLIWNTWAQEWDFRERVTFNGVTRKITIFPEETQASVKADIYSAWVRWHSINENGRFLHALRYVGGDPIGGGQYTAEIFFLMNGWQIVVDHNVQVDGIIYHDDGLPVFEVLPGGGVVNKVAALAYAYTTEVPQVDGAAIAAAVWNHTQ